MEESAQKDLDEEIGRIIAYMPQEVIARIESFIKDHGLPEKSRSMIIRDALKFYLNFIHRQEKKNLFESYDYDMYKNLLENKTPVEEYFKQAISEVNLDLEHIENLPDVPLNAQQQLKQVREKLKDLFRERFDVLIVDDKSGFAYNLSKYFIEKGKKVKIVNTCKECLEELGKFEIGIILLDIHFPEGLQGDELCKQLKAPDSTYRHIPIIFITGFVKKWEIEQKKKETGADEILLKPFDFSELYIIHKYFNE